MKTLGQGNELACTYITKECARRELIKYAELPKKWRTFQLVAMAYDGGKHLKWTFPLAEYIPLRCNHTPWELEARRFTDETVMHFALSGEEFARKVCPLEELDCHIAIADYVGNPSWGYYSAVFRLNGWPYRVGMIYTEDGLGEDEETGEKGHIELDVGMQHFDPDAIWYLLEGAPCMGWNEEKQKMEFQGNQRIGCKYTCQLYELDIVSPKKDTRELFDYEIDPKVAYIHFEIVDTVTVPSTGKKGVKVKILPGGIVPCWMDLPSMQVWAGALPLGYLTEAFNAKSGATMLVDRVLKNGNDLHGEREITFSHAKWEHIWEEPKKMTEFECVDMCYMLRTCFYQGCRIKVGPRPGKWRQQETNEDEVVRRSAQERIDYPGPRMSGVPAPVVHHDGFVSQSLLAPGP
jgi:hypothetical protein